MSVIQSLRGKRVLVTGAGTGIGLGIAREFAGHGCAVAFHYSHAGDGAEKTAASITKEGGKAVAIKADFNDSAQITALARDAGAFLGGVDILVNNAGITFNKPIEEVTLEQFDTLYRVNVRAPFLLTQAVVGPMAKLGAGAIINISSIHAYQGYQDHSVYAGTRGAIVAFTRQLAVELAPRGIRVNGVAPGSVEVENYYQAMPNFDRAATGRCIPAGFVGQPADIARVVAFLASDEARYIVGQTLIVDGGTTSWMPFGEGFRLPTTGVKFGKGYVPGV